MEVQKKYIAPLSMPKAKIYEGAAEWKKQITISELCLRNCRVFLATAMVAMMNFIPAHFPLLYHWKAEWPLQQK